ncbi:MAG: F0F1 ATP synthase subunit B [Chloroflexi bacterium]|nr:F0F1 ATP synthase subunit B [Chloroflexota bacterium]
MDKLGINPVALLWQFIAFGLLVFGLYKLLYKPVLRMLDERAERIRKGMEDAAKAREMAERAQEEFEKRIAEARKEGQEIVAQATQMSEKLRQEILEQARAEAERMIQKERERLTQEREQAMSELRAQVADLSIMVAQKVVGVSLDENMQRKLIADFLREAGDLK